METTDFSDLNQESQPPKRPNLLMVLAILSFAFIGFSIFSSILTIASGPQTEDQLIEQRVKLAEMADEMRAQDLESMAVTIEKIERMLIALNDHFFTNQLVSMLFLLIGFVGVLFMWQGKKLGFHLYVIYSIGTVIQLYLFVKPADIPSFIVIWNVLISAVFVLLYSRNLSWMKA